eukprot:COSAG04_NODE_1361_length_7086_cov_30.584800_5_plen_122_part_00
MFFHLFGPSATPRTTSTFDIAKVAAFRTASAPAASAQRIQKLVAAVRGVLAQGEYRCDTSWASGMNHQRRSVFSTQPTAWGHSAAALMGRLDAMAVGWYRWGILGVLAVHHRRFSIGPGRK